MSQEKALVGCLIGTAVGDALGLCAEGLSRQRQQHLFPDLDAYHFLFGRGMVSDDTEHTCLVAQALLGSGGDPTRFARSLGRQLRFWLLGVPAGIGFATLRATLRLWLGFPPDRSGVFSAGNGPAMRSALIGVCYGQDRERLRALVRASTRLTHTDPKAEGGALAVAVAAGLASQPEPVTPQRYLIEIEAFLKEAPPELREPLDQAVVSVERGQTTARFAETMGLENGVSGYVWHTGPMVIHAWLRHPGDFRAAVLEIVRCGGDTDTTGAIVGAIVGARVGRAGIPQAWQSDLWEFPRSVVWMERLGQRVDAMRTSGSPQKALPLFLPALLLRNLIFLIVTLVHLQGTSCGIGSSSSHS